MSRDELTQRLAQAAEAGHLAAMDDCLERGANPADKAESGPWAGHTALMAAASRAQPAAMRALLPLSDPTALDPKGRGLLALALRGSSWDAGDGLRHAECLQMAMEATEAMGAAEWLRADAEGCTLLAHALLNDASIQTLEALLPRVDARAADNKGRTPLMLAVSGGSASLRAKKAALLLPFSDPLAQDASMGHNALTHAVRAFDIEATCLLASPEACRAKDLRGHTPLIIAAMLCAPDFHEIAVRLAMASDVAAESEWGSTALSIALDRECKPLVKALWEKGAGHPRVERAVIEQVGLAMRGPYCGVARIQDWVLARLPDRKRAQAWAAMLNPSLAKNDLAPLSSGTWSRSQVFAGFPETAAAEEAGELAREIHCARARGDRGRAGLRL